MTHSTTFALTGSRDPQTGEIYFPPRVFSADGSLRPLEDVQLDRTGVLHSFTRLGDSTYGLVDLAGGVRLQSELAPGEPAIGSVYRLVGDDTAWRFERA